MTTAISRRNFIKSASALGVLGVSSRLFPAWMPRMAFAQSQAQVRGDVLVVIFLRGGIDGLSAVVPYGDGRHYYDSRPTLAVAAPGSGAGSALDLDGYFGFHPALSPLIDVYQSGGLAVVQATGLTNSSRSHFDAMQYMEYGTPESKTTGTGWVGRHLETTASASDSPFRAVGMGAMVQDSLRGQVAPLSLRSIADFHLRGRSDELQRAQEALARLYRTDAPQDDLSTQARMVFTTVEMLQRINAMGYTPANGAVYPDDDEGFGLGLRQVAQLIKANVGLEVACIDLGGWDTHENQGTHGGFFEVHLDVLARGLGAFYADLQDAMAGVTVVTMSEFGRRVAENASAGTDHGHGNFMLVMGGGTDGGRVIADWPTLAPEALVEGDLAITTDYRDVLAEVLTLRMLNPAIESVFPGLSPTPPQIVRAR
jgi:uncharacterized protein (DUF1501 family)